jgi:hypothetical protein
MDGGWDTVAGIPAVRAGWGAGALKVEEWFYCPDLNEARLARRIRVRGGLGRVRLECPLAGERVLESGSEGSAEAVLRYEIRAGGVEASWEEELTPSPDASGYWLGLASCCTGDADLDHLFVSARSQLPTAVDRTGRMDGSIWQYNLEWVRDQAHVVEALVRLGDTELARTMLARLLDRFVSPNGDTVDSGTRRASADVELDQNGELLAALRTYVAWTGDLEVAEERWETVQALAAFPFGIEFLHEASGLLHNRREYWERHSHHGIEDGFELMSQFFVALGLEAAAKVAGMVGEEGDQELWSRRAAELKTALLEDPVYRLVEEGHLIKRRGLDGAWQRTIRMESGQGLPQAIPLLQEGPHYLDPDTSSVLPVAHGFVDPKGELARGTLAHVEALWNQGWEGGGYGRYHASSEPDSPGAWPFASLFVARAYAEARESEKVWRVLRWLAGTPGGASGAWFENDGPRIAPPYPQVGFTPWTWAEMITLFVHHLLGVRPDARGLTLRPFLLEGLEGMNASVTVRGHRLSLSVRRAGPGEGRGGRAEGQELPWEEGGIRFPHLTRELDVEVRC